MPSFMKTVFLSPFAAAQFILLSSGRTGEGNQPATPLVALVRTQGRAGGGLFKVNEEEGPSALLRRPLCH